MSLDGISQAFLPLFQLNRQFIVNTKVEKRCSPAWNSSVNFLCFTRHFLPQPPRRNCELRTSIFVPFAFPWS